jgi:hypothetical protein
MESRSLSVGTVSGSLLVAIAATIAIAAFAYVQRPTTENPFGSSGSTAAGSAAAANPIAAGEVAAFTREGLTPGQAIQALEAQERLAAQQLAQKLKAALGPAYGGEWFDPATATLHVGVTSAADRRAAEAVAARSGLAGNVVEMPVASTWAQLGAAQDRWDRQRLAGLLARNEVATSLDPRHNAVAVRLGSKVPVAERSALQREAAGAAVAVDITTAAGPKLRVVPDLGRCGKFSEGVANCNPTIVGGQRIQTAKGSCTAGVAALKVDLSQETTETFLVTAGHCIEETGGKGVTWEALNKAGKASAIGKAIAFKNSKADAGVIKVETTNGWAEANNPPVVAAIASWKATEETEPFGVPGEFFTGVGKASCYSGQRSGVKCGTVAFVNETIGTLENAVEVKGMTAKKGDSGAPFYSHEETTKDHVEGILSGVEETSGNVVYSPIRWSFEQLNSEIELELLTESNQVRPNEPMK